jgi:hypothetical protein
MLIRFALGVNGGAGMVNLILRRFRVNCSIEAAQFITNFFTDLVTPVAEQLVLYLHPPSGRARSSTHKKTAWLRHPATPTKILNRKTLFGRPGGVRVVDGTAVPLVETSKANAFATSGATVPKKALSKLLNCAIVFA